MLFFFFFCGFLDRWCSERWTFRWVANGFKIAATYDWCSQLGNWDCLLISLLANPISNVSGHLLLITCQRSQAVMASENVTEFAVRCPALSSYGRHIWKKMWRSTWYTRLYWAVCKPERYQNLTLPKAAFRTPEFLVSEACVVDIRTWANDGEWLNDLHCIDVLTILL